MVSLPFFSRLRKCGNNKATCRNVIIIINMMDLIIIPNINVAIIVTAVGRRRSPRRYCRASYARQSRYSSQSVKSENRS